jgi:hypothetical protein
MSDGINAYQIYQFGYYILQDPGMETVGIYYGHLIYFVALWYILHMFIQYIFFVLVCRNLKNLTTLFVTWFQPRLRDLDILKNLIWSDDAFISQLKSHKLHILSDLTLNG